MYVYVIIYIFWKDVKGGGKKKYLNALRNFDENYGKSLRQRYAICWRKIQTERGLISFYSVVVDKFAVLRQK